MFKFLHYDAIDSTNLEARRLIETGQLHAPTLLQAERQISGQGSRGRSWVSEKGNLYISFVFPLKTKDRDCRAVYPVALATQKFIAGLVSEPAVQIKWPNDILISERKVAGMLLELCSQDNQTILIAGIGINITHHPQATANFPAAHVQEFQPLRRSLSCLAQELGAHLEQELIDWKTNGIEAIYDQIYPKFYHLNQEIKVTLHHAPEEPLYGIFKGINPEGGLILKQGERKRIIYTGDIFPTFLS